jgi:NAD(P)-dependent dehydrogenase (short-subunit alcohol dehydrogenase family)
MERASAGGADLRGRVAMVTGAGRGSAAIAAARAGSGVSVVLGAPDELAIARVARSVEARGGRALAVGTDLGDPDAVARLTEATFGVFDRLDAAVNAPGRARGLDHLAEPDCRAVYFAVRHQRPAIAGFGGGAIVNVALGPLGWSDDARCVVGLTRASALEHSGSRVRINALARNRAAGPARDRPLALLRCRPRAERGGRERTGERRRAGAAPGRPAGRQRGLAGGPSPSIDGAGAIERL